MSGRTRSGPREREHRLHELLQGMPDALVVVDAEGVIRDVSRQTECLFGYCRADLVGRPVELLVPEAARGLHVAHRSSYVAAEHPRAMGTGLGIQGRRRDGSLVPVEISISSVRLDDGPAVIAAVRDVTETRALQQRLHASEELFRRAFAGAPTGMILTELGPTNRGRIVLTNTAFCQLVGRAGDELVGTLAIDCLHPDDVEGSRAAAAALACGATDAVQSERRLRHRDGYDVWTRLTTSVVPALDGTPLYAVTQVEDVTERRQAERELAHLALHDGLTGLPNRVLLLDHLSQALARAARRPEALVAVLYLDLDNFKDVNDALGHAAGDELLVELAARLCAALRASDTPARLGGDEFVVVCEDLAHPAESGIIAARIQQALDVEVPIRDASIRVGASIGITVSHGHDEAEDLLREADTAMYQAKRAGRGDYALADPTSQARALRQVKVAADLRRALAFGGEFVLHYQPAVELLTGAIVAVEALLRWQHPERGLLLPGEFLDVAEDREVMVDLGSWVLEAACRDAARWHRALGGAAPQMWVNVSSRQLGRAELTARVTRVLTETGLPPELLCLELTERQVVDLDAAVRTDLSGLTALGCHLAIDDFGTGHNDMSHLRALPVDALKIDRSYVEGLGSDRTNTAITRSMITLGHALGLIVVAEGVEVEQQQEQLISLGCDLAQGFGLHRPVPSEEADRLLVRA